MLVRHPGIELGHSRQKRFPAERGDYVREATQHLVLVLEQQRPSGFVELRHHDASDVGVALRTDVDCKSGQLLRERRGDEQFALKRADTRLVSLVLSGRDQGHLEALDALRSDHLPHERSGHRAHDR